MFKETSPVDQIALRRLWKSFSEELLGWIIDILFICTTLKAVITIIRVILSEKVV